MHCLHCHAPLQMRDFCQCSALGKLKAAAMKHCRVAPIAGTSVWPVLRFLRLLWKLRDWQFLFPFKTAKIYEHIGTIGCGKSSTNSSTTKHFAWQGRGLEWHWDGLVLQLGSLRGLRKFRRTFFSTFCWCFTMFYEEWFCSLLASLPLPAPSKSSNWKRRKKQTFVLLCANGPHFNTGDYCTSYMVLCDSLEAAADIYCFRNSSKFSQSRAKGSADSWGLFWSR